MKHSLITLLSLEALEAIEMARDQNHKYQEVLDGGGVYRESAHQKPCDRLSSVHQKL